MLFTFIVLLNEENLWEIICKSQFLILKFKKQTKTKQTQYYHLHVKFSLWHSLQQFLTKGKCFPNHKTINNHVTVIWFYTCCANSLVGANTRAWHSSKDTSICCKIEMENVAVFPVPDWACAITSSPRKQDINMQPMNALSLQANWCTNKVHFIFHEKSQDQRPPLNTLPLLASRWEKAKSGPDLK